jgi:hypothetical protein
MSSRKSFNILCEPQELGQRHKELKIQEMGRGFYKGRRGSMYENFGQKNVNITSGPSEKKAASCIQHAI